MKKLKPKQEAAALHYVEHGCKVAAYKAAGYSCRGNAATIERAAVRLFENVHVLSKVEELREALRQRTEEKIAVTTDCKKAWLKTIVERSMQIEPVTDKEGRRTGEYRFDGRTAISAINEMNRMDGDHAPTKTENRHFITLSDFLDGLPE